MDTRIISPALVLTGLLLSPLCFAIPQSSSGGTIHFTGAVAHGGCWHNTQTLTVSCRHQRRIQVHPVPLTSAMVPASHVHVRTTLTMINAADSLASLQLDYD